MGEEHELVVVLNGLETAPSMRGQLLAELVDFDHHLLELQDAVLDLSAYAEAARRLEYGRLCFLNSYSVIQDDGWLAKLSHALDEPRIGLVGATASWESQAEWRRGKARYWLYQLAMLRGARESFHRFPNPHVRTTAFMLDHERVLAMGLSDAKDKHSAYLLESGPESITHKVQSEGLDVVVVGRDGVAYDVADWPQSHTYRAGEQENLLVADNRTCDWDRASPRLRRQLTRDAWGLTEV